MARAKRTDRAEARRRNRATFADPTADGELDTTADDDTPHPAPSARAAAGQRSRVAASSGPAPAPRPGVAAAFRSSFRPFDLRADLRALPRLLIHRAFLAPTVASGLAFILFVLEPNTATSAFYQYFSWQLPIGALFIAGFFAPRASYLIGAAVAVASLLFQLPLLVGQPAELFINSLVGAVAYGSLFAAGAAWYRRFLSRANPNRGRPTTPTSRRPDGKVPKKPQQRPMLARRR